jgi:hypothetical protein
MGRRVRVAAMTPAGVVFASVLALGGCHLQQATPSPHDTTASTTLLNKDSLPMSTAPLLGLRTAKYVAHDLAAARDWYTRVTGSPPYFDQPFYVGFNVGGYELGIVPDEESVVRGESGIPYWGVTNADSSYARLIDLGATPYEPIQDVGGGIRIGAVTDPFGNIFGIIENPGFSLAP